MEKKNLKFKHYVWLIVIALVGVLIINNINKLGDIISTTLRVSFPFILGGCFAFILNIPMSFFEKKLNKIKNKKILRIVSLILAILVVFLVIVLVITLIVPRLVNVVQLLISNIPYYIEQINKFIEQSQFDIQEIEINNIDVEGIKNQILEQIPKLLTSSISIVSSIFGGIYNSIIAIIFTFYILIDKEKLQRQIMKILNAYVKDKAVNKIVHIARVTKNVFKKFFTVQCLEATILGVLCIIGMLILRIPYAVSIGVLIGVVALVPLVGAFIGIIIGAILIVSVSPIKVIYFIVFMLILQEIEGNFIYPRVVGNSVGLPGMWVLFAVSVGGSIGGILGMLVGVPIATTIYILLKEDSNKKIETKKLEQDEKEKT